MQERFSITLSLPCALVLALATAWLPLSGSALARLGPAQDHGAGMSAPAPAMMEAAARYDAFTQPQNRGLFAWPGPHRRERAPAPAAGNFVSRPSAAPALPPGRRSLLAWRRLQLEGG